MGETFTDKLFIGDPLTCELFTETLADALYTAEIFNGELFT